MEQQIFILQVHLWAMRKAVCTRHASGAVRLSIVYKYRSFLNPGSESDASIYKQVLLQRRPYQTHPKKMRHHKIRPKRAPKKRTGRIRVHLA